MLKYRAISFPLLLALLGVMIFWKQGGPYLFAFLAPAAIGLVIYEIGAMLEKAGVKSFCRTAAVFGALSAFYLLRPSHISLGGFLEKNGGFCLLGFLMFAGWLGLLFARDKKKFFTMALTSAGIVLLGGLPLFALGMVYYTGPVTLLYLMLVTKIMDTGGYIAGMLSGKFMKNGNHKMFPAISPKKSWEGTFGGILFSVLCALIFCWFFPLGSNVPPWWYLISGVILAVGSLAGDLTESALKRTCGIKDSGNYIPGMGGVFDVMDSFIYNGALFWVLLELIPKTAWEKLI